MPSAAELAPEFIVDDLEVLKVIAHGTRLDILQSLKLPKTVKEIAKLLEIPATKLYYHVNLMEKHRLIQVVETNIVSGIVEKKYQVVARNYRLDDDLLAKSESVSEDVDAMLGAIFDVTRTEIKRSIAADKMAPTSEDRRGLLWRSNLKLTADQFETFYERLDEILNEIKAVSGQNEAADEHQLYGLTVALYPVFKLPEEEAE